VVVPVHLNRIGVQIPEGEARRSFPFHIPALHDVEALTLEAPITFFVGENGSGKSTLLEALAAATSLPTVGSRSAATDPSLEAQRRLTRCLRLAWRQRTHRGFFLRAEDFFGFARSMSEMRARFETEAEEMAERFKDHSPMARMLAQGPARRSVHEIEQRYGDGLDANSHGESFLKLFRTRFVPGGLYLLDEPEAALSPQSQLALIAMLRDMVEQDSQFIIATHSPILMAIPGSVIYSFDERPAARVPYEDLESVSLMRDFLNAPGRFLGHLWG
jgi:predicted ATPase